MYYNSKILIFKGILTYILNYKKKIKKKKNKKYTKIFY